MTNSAYKVIEVIGTSDSSWEDAARNAVEEASHSLHDMRVAEVKELDMTVSPEGKVSAYRTRVSLSFKYRHED